MFKTLKLLSDKKNKDIRKRLLFTLGCLLVFIVYIAYDIQIIKRNLYTFPEEDNLAVFGALQLYLDFINIFLRLLQLFGKNRD